MYLHSKTCLDTCIFRQRWDILFRTEAVFSWRQKKKWYDVMFNLKLFSAYALYQFGSSSKKVLSISKPSINLNRAIRICKEKLYPGCSVWKDSFSSDTLKLECFSYFSSSKHMLLYVATNLFARIFPYILTLTYIVLILFLLSMHINSGYFFQRFVRMH